MVLANLNNNSMQVNIIVSRTIDLELSKTNKFITKI